MRKNEFQLRHEIVRIGRLMYERGLICASDGNISARLGPGLIMITPSGLHKGLLEPDQLLIVDENGRQATGTINANRHLRPTSELPMHIEAYRQRPDINAVVHAHPPITVALSIAGVPMAECILPEVIVTLGLIPTTQYATPSSNENVQAIRDLIPNHDAIILQRHGSLTVGDSPTEAFMRLESVEQNARIGLMLNQLGVHNPLPPEEVRKLLRQRQEMGLSHPGESDAFCDVCGVCHDGEEHAPTLHMGNSDVLSTTIPSPDSDTIRMLVSQVVSKTLGNSS